MLNFARKPHYCKTDVSRSYFIIMVFNQRTKNYLTEMSAVLIESKYKVFDINFNEMKAFVNKQDIYKKRNGKTCTVQHHFGRWISFKKEDISYGLKNYTRYDSSFYGLEEIKGQKTSKYLKSDVKQNIIEDYKRSL